MLTVYVFRGARPAGRGGVKARANRGTLGLQLPSLPASVRALAIADLPPRIMLHINPTILTSPFNTF